MTFLVSFITQPLVIGMVFAIGLYIFAGNEKNDTVVYWPTDRGDLVSYSWQHWAAQICLVELGICLLLIVVNIFVHGGIRFWFGVTALVAGLLLWFWHYVRGIELVNSTYCRKTGLWRVSVLLVLGFALFIAMMGYPLLAVIIFGVYLVDHLIRFVWWHNHLARENRAINEAKLRAATRHYPIR